MLNKNFLNQTTGQGANVSAPHWFPRDSHKPHIQTLRLVYDQNLLLTAIWVIPYQDSVSLRAELLLGSNRGFISQHLEMPPLMVPYSVGGYLSCSRP